MKIEYDKNIDSKYIRIKEGKVASTKKEKPWLLFDKAEDGSVLGVEILHASKHPLLLNIVDDVLLGYGTQKDIVPALSLENESLVPYTPKIAESNIVKT